MGVKGLLSLLSKFTDFHELFLETIPRESILLIDGNNFMFYLMGLYINNTSTTTTDEQIDRRYGGSYEEFREIIIREFHYLCYELGFQLEVYFDGYDDHNVHTFKGLVIEEREKYRIKSWENLYKMILYRSKVINQDSLPLPPLTRFLLEFYLKRDVIQEGRIRFIQCRGEADIDMSKRCQELNHLYEQYEQSKGEKGSAVTSSPPSPPRKAFIYSDDSDFFVMKNIPTIKFESFSLHYMEIRSNPSSLCCHTSSASYSVEVWHRTKIANLLGFHEEQFMDFCIFLGCDFTKSFPRSYFSLTINNNKDDIIAGQKNSDEKAMTKEIPKFRAGGSPFLVCKIYDYIKGELGNEFVLSALKEYPLLQEAIDYSRKFYRVELKDEEYDEQKHQDGDQEREDNEEYDDDADKTSEEEEKSEESEESTVTSSQGTQYGLDEGSVELLKESFVTYLLSSRKMIHFYEVPHLIVKFMKDYLETSKTTAETSDPAISEVAEPLFEEIHVEAIDQMIKLLEEKDLQQQTNLNKDDDKEEKKHDAAGVKDGKFVLEPIWNDILIGKLYQELLLLGIKKTIDYSILKSSVPSDFERLLNYPAHFYYDGRTFHQIIYEIRQRELYDPEEYQEEEEKEEEEENMEEDDEEKNLIETVKDSLKIDKEEADIITSNNSLPVDIHEEKILKQLNSSHFLIIQGETGCGKSTRIPVMIMEEAKRKKQHCQILVCEPHRAATQGLYNRVQSLCPNEEIGLRLGLNERKGSNNSKIIFATAGYVFHRYINAIDDLTPFTHIVIDEIHERSVENDLVCYIVKQLFNNTSIQPRLKVVLMSATVDASIFSDYFMGKTTTKPSSEGEESENNPFALWVGTHPHPTTTYYVEDLGDNPELTELQPVYNQDFFLKRDEIIDYCSNKRDLSNTFFKKQLEVAKDLISQCSIGSSVLIFVSGMSDIQYFEEELKYSKKFQIYPIHSELDRVEEEKALQELTPELKSSIVRVVVATNAAESSITIPDLSIVIDLGTNNREIHDSSNFSRTMIKTTWISKPSAKQRAGRTGRVGPGKVFRLYTKEQYETFSNMIEPEIIKKPLHDVVLRVLGSLSGHFHPQTRTNQSVNSNMVEKSKKSARSPLSPPVAIPPLASVADLLLSFIASPITSPTDSRLIDSLIYLSRNYMITTIPSNLEQVTKCPICHLTPLGRFASEMPLSSHFSRVIVYAQLLGLGGYGIILAAILSEQSFRPFKYKRVVYAHPDDFNDSIRDIFLAMVEIDDNHHVYSEPILLMMLYLLWVKDARSAITYYSLEKKKMDKLHKMIDVYLNRMNLFLDSFQLNLKRADLDELIDRPITSEDIQLLRIILVWISDGNILRLASPDPHHSLVINQLSSSETKTPLYLQKDFFRDTVINHVNTLTERRVRQLFPPRDIPSSLPTLPEGREYGYVKMYNIQKGFGFIAAYDPTNNYQRNNYDSRPKDLFVHRTKIFKKGKVFLREGEIVEFTRSVDQNDSTKFFATHVTALGGGHIVSVSPNYRIPATIQSIDRKIFQVKMRSLKALKLSPAQSTTPITLTPFQFQSRILRGVPGTPVAHSPSNVEAVWSWTRFPEAISGIHSMAVFAVKGVKPDRLSDLRTVLMNAMIHDSRPIHRGSHYIEEEDTKEGKGEKADEEATNPPTAQFVSLQEIHTRLGLSNESLQEVEKPLPSSVEFITIINPPLSGNHLIRQILLLYPSGIEFFFSDHFIGRLESEFTFFTYNIPLAPITLLTLLNSLINHQIDPTKTVSYKRRPFLRIQYHQSTGSESKEFRDLPIGMRLLNAYCAHQRYRCLTVGNIDYIPENETQHHQWYEISLPRQTNLHGYYAKWELLQSKLAIDTRASPSDQKKEEGETTAASKSVVKSFAEEEWSRAKIDYYSYLAYSYPQFKDPTREGPVYAVANAVLISQRGEDRVNINCDQVTFLPYDEHTLLLIMVSISQRWMTYVQDFPDSDRGKQEANNIRKMFEDMVYNRDSSILLFREDPRFRAAVLRLLRHLITGKNEVANLPGPTTAIAGGRGGPSNFGRGSSNTRSNDSDRGNGHQGYQRRSNSSHSERGNDEGRSRGYGYHRGNGRSTNNRWNQSDRGSDQQDYRRQANSSYRSDGGSEERYQGGYQARQPNDRIHPGTNHHVQRQGYGRENEYRGGEGRGYQGGYQRNNQGPAERGYGVYSQQQPPQTRPIQQRASNGDRRTSHNNRFHDEDDEDEDRDYNDYDYED